MFFSFKEKPFFFNPFNLTQGLKKKEAVVLIMVGDLKSIQKA